MGSNDKIQAPLSREGRSERIDPATRLSELLAQSLEELTRPFDPTTGPSKATRHALEPTEAGTPPAITEETRLDADRALAELEAELFAAARVVEKAPSPLPAASLPHIREIESQLRAVT